MEESKQIEKKVSEEVLEGEESKNKLGEDKNNVKIETKEEKKKRSEIKINAYNLKISTKHSIALCRFIKNKSVEKAIEDLEQVVKLKKPVPMKGEIPHRKGRIMSGRFPKKTATNFIKVLKNVLATSHNEGIENPIIIEAISNIGNRPYGRFGRFRKKRTHIKIIAGPKKNNEIKTSQTI
ncbi:MAG: uL22 family ribosomal protein [Candidatus Pacearchaeota archaeon]